METEPKVYVGTYAKYNNGNLSGKWLNLADYQSMEEFVNECNELHNDEDDPELMYQDTQGFPDVLDIEDVIEILANYDDSDAEVIFDWIDNMGKTKNYKDILDAYVGKFDDYQLDDYLVETFLECQEVPDNIRPWLDDGRIARDMMHDYTHTANGFLFRDF